MFKNISIKWIFIIAIILRLFVAPFFYHPDIKTYNYQASFLKQGVFDIYSYLPEHKSELTLKEEFVYFPITYFVLGGWQFIMQPLFGSEFDAWLGNASQTFLAESGTYRYLLLMKLPYLILDILIGALLMKFGKDALERKKLLVYWLFNPLSIIILYVYSNVDIYPVLFILLSFLAFRNSKLFVSALLLGLAAAFKAFPLLLLPFILPFIPQVKARVVYAITALVVFIVSIGPFLPSDAFRNATLVSGLTTRIFFNNIHIGFGEYLMVPIILLAGLFYYTLQYSQKIDLKKNQIFRVIATCFIVFLIVFGSIHYHIQWLLWILPMMTILLVFYSRLSFLLWTVMLFAVSITWLYPDVSATFGIYSGFSSLFLLIPMPFTIVEKVYDPFVVQSVFHSAVLGGSLIAGLELLKGEHNG